MNTKRTTKLIPLLILWLTGTAMASEQLLNQAMSHDQGLAGVRERFEELRKRQQDSRVFSVQELEESSLTIQAVDEVREKQIADMIVALGESINLEDAAARRELYALVADEYDIAIQTLERVVKEQGQRVKDFSEKRELLEKQKNIAEDLRDVARESAEKGFTRDTVEELARLAQEQEDAAETSGEEGLQERMNKAAESMKDAEVEKAIQQAEELVADLEKELNEYGASEELVESETAEALEEALDKVRDIREDLAGDPEPAGNDPEADDEKTARVPMDNSERQETAEKLDEVARELEELGDGSQQEELESAMMDVLMEDDETADEKLARVEEHLEQELENARNPEFPTAPPPSEALAEMEERMEQMEQARQQVQEMQQRMEESASDERPLSEEERAELANAMQEMSEALQENEGEEEPGGAEEPGGSEQQEQMAETEDPSGPKAPKPSKSLAEASEQTENQQDQQAAESLAEAQEQLAGQLETMQSQMEQMASSQPPSNQPPSNQPSPPSDQPPQPDLASTPPPMNPNDEGPDQIAADKGFGDGTRSAVREENNWTAILPEKERNALRAARQAKYSPHLEPDVTRYFIELAQDPEQ
jgi:hypothetical protein